MKLKDAIEGRQSIRRYHHKKPNWRKILRALDSARLAPAADNIFVMKFILVSNEKKIAQIAEATQQSFVGKAQYLVVAVSDDSKLVRMYEDRGTRFSSQQAGAAIENFLLALVEQGLVTTWVGWFYEDQIKRTLDIPDKMTVEAVFPIGIETKIKTTKKKKIDFENIIYFEKWGEKKMHPEGKISVDAT